MVRSAVNLAAPTSRWKTNHRRYRETPAGEIFHVRIAARRSTEQWKPAYDAYLRRLALRCLRIAAPLVVFVFTLDGVVEGVFRPSLFWWSFWVRITAGLLILALFTASYRRGSERLAFASITATLIIAGRLKEKEQTIADGFSDVSILYAGCMFATSRTLERLGHGCANTAAMPCLPIGLRGVWEVVNTRLSERAARSGAKKSDGCGRSRAPAGKSV